MKRLTNRMAVFRDPNDPLAVLRGFTRWQSLPTAPSVKTSAIGSVRGESNRNGRVFLPFTFII